MSRVLVTGATGFIGSHIVEALLARGDDVTCLTRPGPRRERLGQLAVRQIDGDLRDAHSLANAVANVDVVFHLAGLTHALSKHDLLQVNSEGTRNLVRACAARTSPPVLLVTSSLAAAGPATNGRALCEVDPCDPVSNYGKSKRAAERAVCEMADRLPITIVRPSIVFGARDAVTWELFRPIGRFGVHLVPGLRQRRRYSLIYVDDAVDAMLRVADRGTRLDVAEADASGFQNGCYYVTDEAQPTYGEVGDLIAVALGRPSVIKLPVADLLVKGLGVVSELRCQVRRKPHIFARDKSREATAGSWICTAQRLRDELDFQPAAPLPDRLKQTADGFRENGML